MPKRKFTIALFDENQDGEIIYYQWALPSGKRLDKIDCKMLSEQDLEIFPGAAEGAVNYVDNKTRFRSYFGHGLQKARKFYSIFPNS